MHSFRSSSVTLGLLSAFLVSACTSTSTIPQPDAGDLPVAPESARVDLAMPTFSNPTNVTNPLFPVSSQASVLLVGTVDGMAFRTEVTLLAENRIIEWGGQSVEVLVSQYVAYLDGRIHEVAFDFYAQADDGSVWYFGEDVFNFADGAIANTHGTWIAGRDGPAAMIMPADPKVGDVYRPENIPGLVFEEVTVQQVGQTLDGPLGSIEGGIVVQELHMDGGTEDKTFAPAYGEFFTSDGVDTEALAMAVPTDAASEPVPDSLVTITEGAATVFAAADAGSWDAASAAIEDMTTAWTDYAAGDVPRLVEPLMAEALDALNQAIDAQDAEGARQAAINVAQWSLDLQLRYRPATEVDLGRFDLWLAQLQLDAAAEDADGVNGDLLTLDYVRDRILHAMDASTVAELNLALEELQTSVTDGDFATATEIAQGLRDLVAGL
ncbi:MAG: hypothetical protein AABM41_01545 [Chloroflexota bacterium]